MSGRQQAISGSHAPAWGERSAAVSRPSETNCTTADSDALPSGESTWRGYWWKQKNQLVDGFLEERPRRAVRPVSVRDDVKIREECTAEKDRDGERRRSKPWHAVLNSFLTWYNDYRHMHLRFSSPDGEVVRGQMPNSHQPRYRNRYYARIKAFERQAVREFEDLHVAMLTFTGSMRNARGGWRCPADHLRDVVSSWRPSRGRGVYHALRDSLKNAGVDRWEYASVVEHHKNGYGHVHCAVFVDGEVTQEDFRPAINAHVRTCEIAGPDAHEVGGERGVVSVNRVDPDLDPEDYGAAEDVVGNLGSYIAEYIGASSASEELLERSMSELQLRAVCWSTGTQMVRFSNGANALIRADREQGPGRQTKPDTPTVRPSPGFDPDDPETADGAPFDVVGESGWSLEGICSVDSGGERLFETGVSGVSYVNVDDATHLDPPQVFAAPLEVFDGVG